MHRNDNTIISQDSRNPLHAGHVFRGFPIHLRYGLPGCSPPEKSQVFSLPFMANSLLPSTAGLAAARASRSKLSASQHRFPGVGIGQLPSHFSRLLRAASLKDRDRCIVPPRNHASVAGALTRLRNRKFGDLYGSFSVKFFCCGSLFGAEKAVPRPVACDQVRGARGKVSRDRNASAA